MRRRCSYCICGQRRPRSTPPGTCELWLVSLLSAYKQNHRVLQIHETVSSQMHLQIHETVSSQMHLHIHETVSSQVHLQIHETVSSQMHRQLYAHVWALICLYHMGHARQKHAFEHMRTAKAQISLCICAVWSGPSQSAYRIIERHRMYQWRANVRMRLCMRGINLNLRLLRIIEDLFAWPGPYAVRTFPHGRAQMVMSKGKGYIIRRTRARARARVCVCVWEAGWGGGGRGWGQNAQILSF